MNVIPLTLIISLCLTVTFIAFFWREQTRRRFSSSESESLLPLAEDEPVVIDIAAAAAARAARLGGAKATPAHTACSNHGQAPHRGHAHAAGEECRGNGTCHSCERRKGERQGAHACASDQPA